MSEPQPAPPVTDYEFAKAARTAVCAMYGMTEDDLRSRQRGHLYSQARRLLCGLLCARTRLTLDCVGSILKRDRTTVMHYRNSSMEMGASDPHWAALLSRASDDADAICRERVG
ncbi:MAG: hypothetical protein HRU13_13225 [Phycisphaerales bacterium]|nr:hypothetical protein [Phycisphaerales bacterium]